MLENLVKLSFAECNYKTIVKDDKHQIKKELNKATKSDIIITTGGVSVGKRFNKTLLKELDIKKILKIMIRPGKPFLLEVLKQTYIFFTWQSYFYLCLLSDFYFSFFNKINEIKKYCF